MTGAVVPKLVHFSRGQIGNKHYGYCVATGETSFSDWDG